MTDENLQDSESEIPEDYQEILNRLRQRPVPERSLERFLADASGLGMTTAAWKRGFLNMVMCGFGVCLALLLLTMLVSFFRNDQSAVSLGIAFGLFWVFAIAGVIFSWIAGRASAGPLLLDGGPHPTRGLFLVNAVLMMLAGCGIWGSMSDEYGIVGTLFCFSFAGYWFLMSLGRLQICENGLWQYWSLLKWKRIKSYDWTGDTDATLMIQTAHRFAFLGKGALPVRLEQKEAVDALLKRKMSDTATNGNSMEM